MKYIMILADRKDGQGSTVEEELTALWEQGCDVRAVYYDPNRECMVIIATQYGERDA